MGRMIKTNYHTHAKYCNHAAGEIRDYAEQAYESGLAVLGFSDHTPYRFADGYTSWYRMKPEERETYVREVQACREEFAGKLEIHIGYEVEYYPKHFDALLPELNLTECEYIILGQHFTRNEYDGVYSGDGTEDEAILKEYVDQVCRAMELGVFSYFAHPDLIGYEGDGEIYEKHMSRLCATAAATDTPLEINVRGLKFGSRYPNENFIRIASRYPVKFIIGTDAHEPKDLRPGDEYEAAFRLADKYGLDLIERLKFKKPLLTGTIG